MNIFRSLERQRNCCLCKRTCLAGPVTGSNVCCFFILKSLYVQTIHLLR